MPSPFGIATKSTSRKVPTKSAVTARHLRSSVNGAPSVGPSADRFLFIGIGGRLRSCAANPTVRAQRPRALSGDRAPNEGRTTKAKGFSEGAWRLRYSYVGQELVTDRRFDDWPRLSSGHQFVTHQEHEECKKIRRLGNRRPAS